MIRNIYYNYQSRFLSDSAGKAVSIDQELSYKDQPTWNIHLVDDAGAAIDLSDVAAYAANVDSDFASSTGVMCHTDAADITEADSVVSVPLDAATARFLTVVDGKETVNAYFELLGLDSAGKRVFYVIFPIRAKMILNPGEDVPEEAESLYLERAEAYAVMRAAPEMLYSVAGGSDAGHATQTDYDRYVKYRNSELAGDYSPWMALVQGPPGDSGAIVTLGAASVTFTVTDTGGGRASTVGTVSGDYISITFTKAQLHNITDECEFDLTQIIAGNSENISGDQTIRSRWLGTGELVLYVVTGIFPAGSFVLKPRGVTGRDGMVYDRVTMTGVAITASATPKTHYYTAVSGNVLTVDWSAVSGKDATIWLKLTMPSPVVTITLPSDITAWRDDFGNTASAPDMSTAGTYWIFIHKDAAQVWATGKKVS